MNTLRATLLTAVAPALWGTTYLATTELLPADRPLLAAVVRALPAGLLLLAVARRLPTGSWWWKAPVLGALNIGAFFVLLFVSAYRLPGGVAATVGALQPIIVILLSALLLREKLRLRTALTGLAGVTGVGLLVLQAEARLDPIGVLAGLGGAASMATGLVLVKRWGRPVPLPAFTAWQLTAGGLLLVPALLLLEGLPAAISPTNLVGFGYLALVNSVLGYSIWFWGLDRLPASSAAFLGLLSPIVATVLGWAVLRQTLVPLQLLGLTMTLAAMIIAQRLTANGVSHRVALTPLARRKTMKTVTTSIHIDAPAETVWEALTDSRRFPEWNPFVTELDGRLQVGERLRVRISPPGGKGMSFRPRVTAVIPNQELAWLGSLGIRGLFDGAHSFTIEPLESGGCRFTHAESFSGLLVPLMPGMLIQTEAGFHQMNQALRDRAESMVASR